MGNEILVAMNSDHGSLCKFDKADEIGYKRAEARIAELVKGAANNVRNLNEAGT
jgi:hypothetical protein